MKSKQVLVMRKMGNGCRTGKYCAQAAHASLGALLSLGRIAQDGNSLTIPLDNLFVKQWLVSNFKKVTCYVDNNAALVKIYEDAKAAGIPCALITDAGLTEFGGVPTLTAVGIGPDNEELINTITGHLPLF